MALRPGADDDTYVGLFMVEQPPVVDEAGDCAGVVPARAQALGERGEQLRGLLRQPLPPTRPLRLTERALSGQLWLEVPVQNKPVPTEVLTAAKRLSIRIRDVTGRLYE